MNKYKPEKIHRIIIKVSGEFLAGPRGFGFDNESINNFVDDLIEVKRMGFSIGVVLGGGNLFRGQSASELGLGRVVGDNVGMLGTIQNALVVSDIISRRNVNTEIYSAVQIDRMVKFYAPSRAEASLQQGVICFFCAGTGNPYFTTDTAAVLRAVELNADLVLKGTKVDGVYTADPMKNKSAKFIETISYDEALKNKLNVMDMTAFSLARDYKMKIKVFNITQKGNLKEAILNRGVGTFIHE